MLLGGALGVHVGVPADSQAVEAPRAAEASEDEPPAAALLGAPREALRKRFGDALTPAAISLPRPVSEQVREVTGKVPGGDAAQASPAFAGQERVGRLLEGPVVRRVEYDLADGRVYRVRHALAERYERPVFSALLARLRGRLGPPVYDQTIPAKLGSGKVDLRRARWQAGGVALDLRQLHPLTGGPIFVTLSDLAAVQRIIDAGRIALPEPSTSGDWWRRPQPGPRAAVPDPDERDALLDDFDETFPRFGFPPEAEPGAVSSDRRGSRGTSSACGPASSRR